ncbi:hypothetical protein H5410_061945 [Solanum commersonii]|uniref:Uncharacterized protein n=1 Tax=Solanum commersonii TaxID=4109 RepID=A0A9J5W933_SOLCO|nr:hypothetical protein H5410_061945 [Solanum commersonii]
MLESLNEIDPVTFYTSFNVPSPSKMSTIAPVNIAEASPLNPNLLLTSITQYPHINLVPTQPFYTTTCLKVIFPIVNPLSPTFLLLVTSLSSKVWQR